MNFTIALNTIIYLMVFIFPGILFRKFYFRGDFTRQFDQGNLLERFIWTLLFSILSLILCFFFIDFMGFCFNVKFLDSISYKTVKEIFDSLSSNKLPEEEIFGKSAVEFLYLILAIYILSSVLGFVLYNLIRILNLDKKFSIFTFSNYWHYLTTANERNGVFKSRSKYFTLADILISGKNGDELISGTLYKYHINNDNKLECIVLTQAYKYKKIEKADAAEALTSIAKNEGIYEIHKETSTHYIFKRFISGNLLTIFNENIQNINLTYVRQINNSNNLIIFKKYLYWIINVLYYLSILIIFFIPWIDLAHVDLNSIPKKIVFLVFTYMFLTSWVGYINQLLGVRTSNKNSFLRTLTGTILLSIPNLWAFSLINIWQMIGLFVSFFIIIVAITAYREIKHQGTK